jgi:predicted DNA-binding protein (MmcQ/YjbR family)
MAAKARKYEQILRDHALSFPETHEDFPWGERALKVKGKVFVFMSKDGDHLSLSVKLPNTGGFALSLPFCEPTHYGLGKHGWVSAKFEGKDPPIPMLLEWIDESYRANAPKTLLKKIASGEGIAPKRKVTKKKTTKKKKTAKRSS